MSLISTKLNVEELRSIEYSSISDSYEPLGTSYENPIIIYHLQNLTDVSIVYSWDGVTDHGVVASGGFILLDVTANKNVTSQLNIPKGFQTYVRSFTGGNPSSGSVYLTLFYGA